MSEGSGSGLITESGLGAAVPWPYRVTQEDTLRLVLTEEDRGGCLAACTCMPLLPTAHRIYPDLIHLEQ